jgi:hypothetical protein
MTQPHNWRECRLVILEVDADDGRVIGKSSPPALETAWSSVPDRDRELFHMFCCLNVHTQATHDAINRISALVKAAEPESSR